jgi:CheY-like chemotaxis protein
MAATNGIDDPQGGGMPMPNPAPHVLIMDDSPAVVDLLQEFLEEEGYRVTASHELLEVTHIAGLAPDLVLLEWRFGDDPDAGWHHVLRLRLEPATSWTPLVLCTTDDRPRRDCQIAQVLERLHVAVVRKPFPLQHLLDVMQRAMRLPSLPFLNDTHRAPPIDQMVGHQAGDLHQPHR